MNHKTMWPYPSTDLFINPFVEAYTVLVNIHCSSRSEHYPDIKIFFLFLCENMLWVLIGSPLADASMSMYAQHLFSWRNKKKKTSTFFVFLSVAMIYIHNSEKFSRKSHNYRAWLANHASRKSKQTMMENTHTSLNEINSTCLITIVCLSFITVVCLTLVLLNPDIPCLCKQCRSRSVGFWSGSALFAIKYVNL